MKGKRERNMNFLFYLLMYLLVVSFMCPDPRSNPQPWHMGDDTQTSWATQPGLNSKDLSWNPSETNKFHLLK